MISAVDSSVLLDVLAADPIHGSSSRQLLEDAYEMGGLIASEIVYAEVASQFDDQRSLDKAFQYLSIRLVCGGADAAYLAGYKWIQYRRAGGTRTRLLADFLIGAHASIHADRLLTRDRGFFGTYFPELTILGG